MMESELLRALLAGGDTGSRFFGVVVGIVTNNQDPENMHRVKVRFPWLSQGEESYWARVASAMAGKGRGLYLLPEVDDEVLVAFEHGAIDFPYVLGSLWNGKDAPPESNEDNENNNRTLKSRSGHIIRLGDKQGEETIEVIDKSGHNKIVIKTADNSVTIEAQGDITIKSTNGKLTLSAMSGVELKSQAGVDIQATQSVDVKANAQVNVKGAMINLN